MIAMICSLTDDRSEREFMLDLYESYKGLMMSTALRYCSDHAAAEDIVHDGVVKLIGKVTALRSMERCVLAGYIVAAIRNTAISYLRAQDTAKRHSAALDEESCDAAALSLEELTELREWFAALSRVWPQLGEEDRFLLEGKYLLELCDEELAQQLGCKSDSIRMKLTRARRRAYDLVMQGGKKE